MTVCTELYKVVVTVIPNIQLIAFKMKLLLIFAIFCAFAFAQEESSSSPDEGSSESPTKKPLLPALPPLLPPHGHGKPPGFMRGPIIIFNRSRDTPPKG